MNYPFSIFINTTDTFEDCWIPFFKLFSNYWPAYRGRIYLNTETKDFAYGDLDIVAVKNAAAGKSVGAWSQCLQMGIASVENDIILYMQEDYFLRAPVEHDVIMNFAIMMQNHEMDCIHLTDQHSAGPFEPSVFENLWLMGKRDFHKISCQAALWKKSIMLQYIRKHENPWQFELYGTLRAQLMKHRFYTVSRDIYKENQKEVIPYIFTGIIQGKWYRKVVGLFAEHDIRVDFDQRGFIGEKQRFAFLPRVRRKIKDINGVSIFEILKMKCLNRKISGL
jgi:hypothetical protein